MGSLEEPSWMKLPEIEIDDSLIGAIPENFDARTNWPNC